MNSNPPRSYPLTHRDIWRQRNASTPLWLYRLYSEDGSLLYVGITRDLRQRWSEHRRDKSWWTLVARHTSTWYADRKAARTAELDAIDTENPRYNIAARGALRRPSEVR